jgi:hypothetical protein
MNTIAEALTFAVSFVGGSAVLLTGVVWLLQKWFAHGLTRDLANHQAALDRATTAESQRLRHELELVAADVVKRTTLLNEKRAEVIAEMHRKLVNYTNASSEFVNVLHVNEGLVPDGRRFNATANEFFEYFDHHRIYFSEAFCDGVVELTDVIQTCTMPLQKSALAGLPGIRNKMSDADKAAWTKANETLSSSGAPKLLRQLEREFRALLGVKNVDQD